LLFVQLVDLLDFSFVVTEGGLGLVDGSFVDLLPIGRPSFFVVLLFAIGKHNGWESEVRLGAFANVVVHFFFIFLLELFESSWVDRFVSDG
jgi:hypothetical protein